MKTKLLAAIEIIKSNRDISDNDLFEALRNSGFTASEAEKTIAFLPTAFFRSMMATTELKFSDHYVVVNEDGKESDKKCIKDEDVYNVSHVLSKDAEGGDSYLAIAGRSAEFHAVNSALKSGSELKDLELSPLVIMLSESEEQDGIETNKPWWKVW